MLKRIIVCLLALVVACSTAQAASFLDLLGIEPTETPEARRYALPDIELVMRTVPELREGDYTPKGYEGTRYRFDYEEPGEALQRAEALYNEMLALGYAAQSVVIDQNVNSILFTQEDARVLLVPIPDTGHVSVILCDGASYDIEVRQEAMPGDAPLPTLGDVMGVSGETMDAFETEWGFSIQLWVYAYDSAREMVAAMNALQVELQARGYTKLALRMEDVWCWAYRYNGAHVLVMPDVDNAVCGVGLETGMPFYPMPDEGAPDPIITPAATPTPAPTATPAPTEAPMAGPALPDFGAFIGWTPTESHVLYTRAEDGTEYYCDVYYGYVESVVREYVELLKQPRFGLAIRDENVITQMEGGMSLESTFACQNAEGLGSGIPGVPGSRVDILLTSNSAQNVMMLLLYPDGLPKIDAGERSSMYGQLRQGAPVRSDAGGSQGGIGASSDECALCHGTGVCYYCNGAGTIYTLQGKQACPSCYHESGVCKWCDGKGTN